MTSLFELLQNNLLLEENTNHLQFKSVVLVCSSSVALAVQLKMLVTVGVIMRP